LIWVGMAWFADADISEVLPSGGKKNTQRVIQFNKQERRGAVREEYV